APEVTRQRLYLDTMQEVFSNTSKVLVTGDKGQNNLLYLPLDKMIESSRSTTGNGSATGTPSQSNTDTAARAADTQQRGEVRTRETR
ncbi:HflK protein, partial [Pseudomonas syringae pv. maculicola]